MQQLECEPLWIKQNTCIFILSIMERHFYQGFEQIMRIRWMISLHCRFFILFWELTGYHNDTVSHQKNSDVKNSQNVTFGAFLTRTVCYQAQWLNQHYSPNLQQRRSRWQLNKRKKNKIFQQLFKLMNVQKKLRRAFLQIHLQHEIKPLTSNFCSKWFKVTHNSITPCVYNPCTQNALTNTYLYICPVLLN